MAGLVALEEAQGLWPPECGGSDIGPRHSDAERHAGPIPHKRQIRLTSQPTWDYVPQAPLPQTASLEPPR